MHGLDTSWRGRLAYAVLLGTGLCIALIFTAIAPVLSTIASHFGGAARGHVVAQLLMTLPSIGVILGGPVAGLLVERFGAKRVLYASLAAYAATGSAGLYLDALYTLLATRFLLGIAGVSVATSATALFAELLDEHRRVRAIGYWSAVGSAGSVVSILIAGSLAQALGWQGPFALYAIMLFALALAIYSLHSVRPFVESSSRSAAAGPALPLRTLWPLYALIATVAIVVFMTGIQVSFLLGANGVDSPRAQSWIIAAASLGSMTGATSYGLVQQRIGHSHCFVLSLSLMAAGNLVLGTQESMEMLALGCLLNGWGGGMTLPYFSNRVIEQTSADQRGRALGLMYTMIFVGEFANPVVVTPLTLRFGIETAFVVVGLLTAGGAVYALTRWRSKTRVLPEPQ